MLRAALIVVAAAFVAGCDGEAKTFGRSYDECILKHSSGGQNQILLAQPSCQRHFEQPAPPTATADVNAVLHTQGGRRWMTFTLSNTTETMIITAVTVAVIYTDDKQQDPQPWRWSYAVFLLPDQQTELTGGMDGAPERTNFTANVQVKRVVTKQ